MTRVLGAVLTAAVVLTAGVALAQGGPGAGTGPGYQRGANSAEVKKFQRETLALRDELAAKRVDLEEENDKAEPDRARIASLRKDIVDIEAKIQTVADKHGLRGWGRGHGGSMMHGWDGAGYARGSGPGCGCGRW